MADESDEQFTWVGDFDALPDAFFDALADLLLDIHQACESEKEAEDKVA